MIITIFISLILIQSLILCHGLITSSKSSKQNRFQPKRPKQPAGGSGGVGFGGGGAKVISPEYTPVKSPELTNLLKFLTTDQNSLGLDPSNGGAIEVGTTTGGRRGMFSTAPLKKNDIICQIPSDCGLALADPTLDEDVSTVQAAYNFLRLYRKDPARSQQWKAVLDMLPQSKTDSHITLTPDYYEDEELELFEFPPLIQQIKNRLIEIQQIVETQQDLTYEELQFATHLVSSRSVAVPLGAESVLDEKGRAILKIEENPKLIRILIPFLDMVNHASVKNANCELHLIDPEKDNAWFALKAKDNIPQGSELFIPYGSSGVETSSDIVRDYGFCPSNHKPVDQLMLKKLQEQEPAAYPKWTTTLKEDTFMLKDGEEEGDLGHELSTILQLRAALKKAEAESKKE